MGGEPFLLTVCTHNHQPLLVGDGRLMVANLLSRHAADRSGPALAWVVMPDHVHILIAGVPDVVQWVRTFKAAVVSSLRRRGIAGFAWQRSFHDRGIRRTENLPEVVRYMLENPVRAGLCASWESWPWSYGVGVKDAGEV